MSELAVFDSAQVRALGWMLVHFVWQGVLVALALAVMNARLPRRAARLRYSAASAALLVMLALPIATFFAMSDTPLRPAAAGSGSASPLLAAAATRSAAGPTQAGWIGLEERLAVGLPWLVVGWSLGVSVMAIRFLGGWFLVRRLDRSGSALPRWQAALDRLRRELRISRPVLVCESLLVEVPTAVGWLRPAILLPAATLAGLTPMQLEVILAHELAHIRRLDYLVNLVQTLAETLFFYHPAVWWVSHRMSVEREHCCDDAAVALCGDARAYARALAEMERLRSGALGSPRLVLAANGGSLFARVARLVVEPPAREPRASRWQAALLAMAVVVTLGVLASIDRGRSKVEASGRETLGSPAASGQERAPAHPGSSAAAQHQPSSSESTPETGARSELTLEAIMELAENGVTPEYLDRLEALGYHSLSWQTLIELAENGVTPELVEQLRQHGHAQLSPEQLVELASEGVSPEFVGELAELGFSGLSVPDLVGAASQGVTAEFIREMKSLGVSARSLDDYAELAGEGVDPDFVSELKQNGYEDLSTSWLIALRSEGVTPEHVARLRALGHTKLSPARLVALASEGVTPEFIEEMAALGYAELSLPLLIGLRSHGVDAEFVRDLKALGYQQLPVGMLIELSDHGVDAEFVAEMKRAGFDGLSPEQLIERRDRGVDGALLRRFKGARR